MTADTAIALLLTVSTASGVIIAWLAFSLRQAREQIKMLSAQVDDLELTALNSRPGGEDWRRQVL